MNDEVESPTPAPVSKSRKWLPVILSAGVCPGLGQFSQRRYTMGALYLISFIAFVVLYSISIIKPFLQTVDILKGERYEPAQYNWIAILGSFFMSIAVYIVNVVDVWAVEQRRRSKS